MQAKSFGLIASRSSRRHAIRNAITAPTEVIIGDTEVAANKSKNRNCPVLRPEGYRSGCCSLGEVHSGGAFSA